ncbi:MAG: nucleotidyltransferase domain-containing protein [Elusimicrobiota bacterium]|nr:nucleotidyltransferase domain-containing protein [Endomicrobiia bacterium]MDW8166017.1 nucleotidyltransferase domain-containing protein [Elusimicrobiota bacterium]
MLLRKSLNGVEVLSVEKNKLINTLKQIAKGIKYNHPYVLKIILFGSFSKNNFTPYSDVDIAIITTQKFKKNFLERQDDFVDYFKKIPFDVNLLVYTKDEFEKMKKENNAIIREIKRGIIL